MPPVTPQGSRTGLVIWTVITSFLSVLAVILAIYFYVDADSARKEADAQRNKFRQVIAEADLSGPEVNALREAADRAAEQGDTSLNPSMTAMQIALAQRDNLARVIAGQGAADDATAGAEKARSAAKTAVSRAATPLKADGKALPSETLVNVIDTLASSLEARQQEVATLNQQVQDTQAKLEETINNTQAQIQQLTEAMEQVRAEQQQAVSQVTTVTAAKDEQVQTIAGDFERQIAALRDQVTSLQQVNSDLGNRNRQLETELDRVRARLGDIRVDANQAVMRQPDGRIISLPRRDVAFISLGAGDQIVPGMTFEVYDKNDGVPQPPTSPDDQSVPVGKASLEVVRVGPTTSEARIIRQQPGATLSEGDLIFNLVYDRNTQYAFLVYGKFDLDRNGVATVQDAEVIKRLITQWGGSLTDRVNVDTDFVVLGKEPEIPAVDSADLIDPIIKARYDAAVAEAEAYDEISALAREYRIPILNQNRFLYLIGYFSQAPR